LQTYQLAIAARYTSQYQLANDAFRETLKLRPQETDAGIEWAELFLEKYAAQLAEQTLEEVFKVNPNDPDAHAAMAQVIVETRYELSAVRHHLDAALAVNPRNARAFKVRGSIEIDQNQWDAANKTLDAVLAVNKDDVEAIAMKATVAWLRDDTKTYQAEVARALAVDPAYAELYRIVARSAVREHRYVEAIELEKQAVKLKPDFYEAMAGAGLGYLRLGMEKEGIDWLDRSWAGDQYKRADVQYPHAVQGDHPQGVLVRGQQELPDPLPPRREGGAVALPRADDGARVRRHGPALRLQAQDAG